MKPSTKKTDAAVWKLWKTGTTPKQIREDLNLSSVSAVYKALHRERRRRKIPLRKGLGRPRKERKR